MQTGKVAVETVKETGSNVVASAKAGLEKTKTTVQEKVEKITAKDPVEKEMATQKKEEKISQAEREKQEARLRNAASREDVGGVSGGTTAGLYGYGHETVLHPTSALPGQGTGEPIGRVTEGVVGSQPVGITARNRRVGGTPGEQYGTGGGYS